jgi:hypothetical protein
MRVVNQDRRANGFRSRGRVYLRLTTANRRDEEYLATLAHPIKYAAGTHLAIDRHCDRRLDIAIFDQMLGESGELPFQIGDELTDIASASGDPIAAISQFAQ